MILSQIPNQFLYGILFCIGIEISFDATAIQIYLFLVLRFRSNALEEIMDIILILLACTYVAIKIHSIIVKPILSIASSSWG
ncbi:MAG: hypothetical protein CMF13_02555 [Idiomarina sp.]|nr:hypothetical protein [Idiomarina sp.]